jgi:hypothetical protein
MVRGDFVAPGTGRPRELCGAVWTPATGLKGVESPAAAVRTTYPQLTNADVAIALRAGDVWSPWKDCRDYPYLICHRNQYVRLTLKLSCKGITYE